MLANLVPNWFWFQCFLALAGQNFTCGIENSLRLNSANYFTGIRSGRVEICSCGSPTLGCEWTTTTIPSMFNSWGWKNALVACRELYPEDYGVMNPILQDTYVSYSTRQMLNNQVCCISLNEHQLHLNYIVAALQWMPDKVSAKCYSGCTHVCALTWHKS